MTRDLAKVHAMVLGLSREGSMIAETRLTRSETIEKRGFEWIAVVHPELHEAFRGSLSALLADIPTGQSGATVLVRRMEAPRLRVRWDGPASSFVCSAAAFLRLWNMEPHRSPEELTFALLNAIMNGRLKVDRLCVRQVPLHQLPRRVAPAAAAIALIMAHRGKPAHLRTALEFIAKASIPNLIVRIGLDVDEPDRYSSLCARYPSMGFFQTASPPVGPYVIRQWLANRSRASLLVFHDSDDISCYDRFTTLATAMNTGGCDLLGCHELRIDEVQRSSMIVRFPLDVSAALRDGPSHVLWHPSSIVRRQAFFKAGGFSTDRGFANDTQFLLRAFFKMRIRNLDDFYYIRRKHPNALTVAPSTCLEHPLRVQLNKTWNADFEAVRQGRMALAQSSLRAIPSSLDHSLIPMRPRGRRHA